MTDFYKCNDPSCPKTESEGEGEGEHLHPIKIQSPEFCVVCKKYYEVGTHKH
jgi:hypothetical protein